MFDAFFPTKLLPFQTNAPRILPFQAFFPSDILPYQAFFPSKHSSLPSILPFFPTKHSSLPSILPFQAFFPSKHSSLPSILPYQAFFPSKHSSLPSILPYQAFFPTKHSSLPSILPFQAFFPSKHSSLPSILPFKHSSLPFPKYVNEMCTTKSPHGRPSPPFLWGICKEFDTQVCVTVMFILFKSLSSIKEGDVIASSVT